MNIATHRVASPTLACQQFVSWWKVREEHWLCGYPSYSYDARLLPPQLTVWRGILSIPQRPGPTREKTLTLLSAVSQLRKRFNLSGDSDPTVRITRRTCGSLYLWQLTLWLWSHHGPRYKYQRSHVVCPTAWVVLTRLRSQPLEWWSYSYNELLVTRWVLCSPWMLSGTKHGEWQQTWWDIKQTIYN